MRNTAIPAFLLLLAGCAGEPDVYAIVQDRAYTPSEFRFASQYKDFQTVIAGDLYSQPRRQVRDDILAAMQPENWWSSQAFTPRTRFTDAPVTKDTPYHVTVSLNPAKNADPASYCPLQDQPPVPKAIQTKDITVRMAFCRDGILLSTSHGILNNVESSADPRFRKMITRMTMALFPQRRDKDSDCGPLRNRSSC